MDKWLFLMHFSVRYTSTPLSQLEFIIKGYSFLSSSYPNKRIFLYFLSFHESFSLLISLFCKKHEHLDDLDRIRVPNISRCMNSRFPKIHTTQKRGSSSTHSTLVLRTTSFDVHDEQSPAIIRLSSGARAFSNSQRIRSSCRLFKRQRNTEYCKLSPYPFKRLKQRRQRLESRMS